MGEERRHRGTAWEDGGEAEGDAAGEPGDSAVAASDCCVGRKERLGVFLVDCGVGLRGIIVGVPRADGGEGCRGGVRGEVMECRAGQRMK